MIKKAALIISLIATLNAQTLNFIFPFAEENTTQQNVSEPKPKDLNKTESNTSKTFLTYEIQTDEEDFNDTYVSFNAKASIAVVINKKRFFKYLPSLMNALNAYYSQKGIDYQITLYNSDINISNIKADDILYFTTDAKDLSKLEDYNKTFYFPLLNINDSNTTKANFYFGAIDFKAQLNALTAFIDDKTDIIAENTILSNKLLSYEKNLTFLNNIYTYPNIYYKDLNNSFVIFNTGAGKTAQVLSKITQKEIQTKLTLTPQLGYDPLLIILTQPADVEKLLIANSIIHPPLIINESTHLLSSDIRYNWINYASCILANKAYNRQNGEDEFYMSDFNIYIFNNQINYKTRLYRIIDGAFKEVE